MSYNEEIKKRRVHTFPYDTVLNINLTQDVDFLEILSLKINQKDLYKLHTSNYGMLVGRVLANDSFGIPNCKVSIFIPINDDDKKNIDISNLYPYTNVNSIDSNGVRYNLLPDENTTDECYSVVGTFPNKRLMLDNDTILEIFDKYWKYTTVTNECGDYFIASVPVGNCTIHIDFDISDIGILSQRPRDMIYKGYNITQFENANQFKQSTNLNSLSQLYSQNQVVYIYPFCGEDDLNNISITRCDIQVQYKFEPTCIFMGAIVTDTYGSSIGHNCKPFRTSGYNRSLIASEGIIEMIRKTTDGLTEEFQIRGNRLIDGDGIWCYQIPMNLDYVKMDEFGNIVPTDDPSKGIPTRTRVRFRLSLQESENDGISRHRAKYLIPNNPILTNNQTPQLDKSNDKTLEGYYEFGSATDEESYRDLYWNNVYSVKNYIPRLQTSKKASSRNYTGIRTVNYSDAKNPAPFNKIRLRLTFTYRLSCIIATIVLLVINIINITVIKIINDLFGAICGIHIWKWKPFKKFCSWMVACIEFPFLTDTDEGDCETKCYFPGCKGSHSIDKTKKDNPDCDSIENGHKTMKQKIEQLLAEENEAVNLDFYNDWLNGSLYLPLWYWKKRRKKTFFFGLISKKAVNAYCNCDKKIKLHLFYPCTFQYNTNDFSILNLNEEKNKDRWHDKAVNYFNIGYGMIKEKVLSNGLSAYYYSCGIEMTNSTFVRMFATDIILLGSLNKCDINGIPQLFKNLPSTTSNIMPVNRDVDVPCNTENDEDTIQEVTGMDFFTSSELKSDALYGNGYFMDIACSTIVTLPKTCVNAERLSELGVALDMSYTNIVAQGSALSEVNSTADGMVTRFEIEDNESRSMFATLNHNGLSKLRYNSNLGYYYYDLYYLYPIDFDGRMNNYSATYTSSLRTKTYDFKNNSYLLYRLGEIKHFYNDKFPLYNNSFYFYFGLNEGNTAIDKFTNLYFSQCFKDKKYPFNLKVVSRPAAWIPLTSNCEYDSSKLGYIKIVFENITVPYSLTIENSLGKKIVSNLISSSLILEYDKYLPNNTPIINEMYTFIITDANGDTLTQIINLSQQQIYLEFETKNLSKKYFPDSQKDEFCGKFNGKFLFNAILIDNTEYEVESIELIEYNIFKCNLVNVKDFYAILTFNSLSGNVDFTCGAPFKNDVGQWEIGIWQPGFYELKIEQKIPNLSDDCPLYEPNISTNIFQILNGKSFDMIVNDVLLRFLLGKKYDNPKFAILKNGEVESYTNIKDSWLKIYDPDTYAFNEYLDANNISQSIIDNIEYWEDAISVDADAILSGDREALATAIFLTKSYQLRTVLNMSFGTYLTTMVTPEVTISHIGGIAPVKYKTYLIPIENIEIKEGDEDIDEGDITEDDFNMGNTPVEVIIPQYEFGSEAGYIYPEELPFYVGSNYTIYEDNQWKNVETGINPLYNEEPWAYFAIYDNNGNGSYKCPPYIESHLSNNIQKYFRTIDVDKRLDFDIPLLISSIANKEIIARFTWIDGYVHLKLINGIALGYEIENETPYIYRNGAKGNYEYYNDNGFIKHNKECLPKYVTALINDINVQYVKKPSTQEDVLIMDNRNNFPTFDEYFSHQLQGKNTFTFNIMTCSYNATISENMPKLEASVNNGDDITCKIQLLNTVICLNVNVNYSANKMKWNNFHCVAENISISSVTLLPDIENIADYLMLSEIPRLVKLNGDENENNLVEKYNVATKANVKTLSSGVSVNGNYLYYNGDYLYDNNTVKYVSNVFTFDNLDISDANYVSVVLHRKFLPNRFISKTVNLFNVTNTYDIRGFDLTLIDVLTSETDNCSLIFEVFYPTSSYNESLTHISRINMTYNNRFYNGELYKEINLNNGNQIAKQFIFNNIPNTIISSNQTISMTILFTLYTLTINNIVLEPIY